MFFYSFSFRQILPLRLSAVENDVSASEHLMMTDTESPERFSAESHAFYIAVSFLLYHKTSGPCILRVKSNLDPVEYRCGKSVVRLARTVRVESHHGEHGPCRHGAGIIVSRYAVRLGTVISVQQHLHGLLGAPFLALEITEKVRICDIRLICRVIQALVKYHLELVHELLLASHQFCQPRHVMRHIESIVPCAAFMEARSSLEVLALARIERRIEAPVHHQRPECTVFRTIIMLVAERCSLETGGIFLVSQGISQQGKRVVGDIIFECMRNGIVS